MIGVIDIGIGNFKSVEKSLQMLDASYCKVTTSDDFLNISKLIFPGVGSFPTAMKRLNDHGIVEPIKEHIKAGNSYLGICLGMQLLSKVGLEGGVTQGLGMLDAEVVKMYPANNEPIPHIGWNQINHDGESLFAGISKNADFYFVHSFYMKLNERLKNFSVNYGGLHTCFVEKDNIFGAQFHPEKSQIVGLKFMENFLNA
jgi:glutamine amidotransferase